MIDTASDVAGSASVNCNMKTVIERRMVTPSVSFSPESGGSVKPSSVIDEMMEHGMIKLKP